MSADNVVKELDIALVNTQDEMRKKRIKNLIKEADKLSEDLRKCKKMCDMHKDGTSEMPAKKKVHAKKAVKAKAAAKK